MATALVRAGRKTRWRRASSASRTYSLPRDLERLFVENAFAIGKPKRALAVVEALGNGHVPVGDTRGSHLAFNGIRVRAALDRHQEALRRARALVRYGFETVFRFDLPAAAMYTWTQRVRQNQVLAPLTAMPACQAFLH